MDRELTLKISSDRSQAKHAVEEELRDHQRMRDSVREMHAEKLRMSRQAASEIVAATRQSSAEEAKASNRVRAAIKLQGQEWREHFRLKSKEDRAATDAMMYNMNQIRRSLRDMTTERVRGSREAGDAEKKGLDGVKGSAGGALGAVKNLGIGLLGLSGAQGVLRGLVDELEKVRKAATDASKEVTGARGDVRELSALRGDAGDTTTTMRDLFKFRRETGQTQSEAIAFQTSALGAGESAIGRQVTAPEFETFMGQAAAFGGMIGVDANTMGTLAGNLPSLMAKPGQRVVAGELTGKLRQLESIFKPGAGTYGQLTDQLLKTSGFTKAGVYKDVADQASLLSFFSLTNREGAGTMVEQFTRATAGGLGRMRGTPTMEGIGSEETQKQAEYLQSIGATEAMDPIQIGVKIAEDVRSSRASKGADFNPFTYLQSKGYGNIEDIQTLMAFEGGLETFQQGFQPLAKAPIDATPKNMMDVRKFQRSDPFAISRQSELADDEATFVQGAGGGEFANEARRQAFAKMKAEGRAYGTMEEWTSRWTLGVGVLRRQAIDFEAMRNINQSLPENRRIELPTETGWATGAFAAEGSRRDLLGRLSEAAILEGLAPVPAQTKTFEQATDVADNIRQMTELARKQAERAPVAPPLRPPIRPNAAPAR